MTKTKITLALKKIEATKQYRCFNEALITHYHLNIEVLKFISLKLNPDKTTKNIKPKDILNDLISIINNEAASKSIISKKNLKILKPWLNKMEVFFKTLKIKNPLNTKSLLVESEKIFAILNISLAKIFIAAKPSRGIK